MSESAIKVGVHRGMKALALHGGWQMRTDDLISMLATGSASEAHGDPQARLMLAIGSGALLDDPDDAGDTCKPRTRTVMQVFEFWQKLGFAASIAAMALLLVLQACQARNAQPWKSASGADGCRFWRSGS
jgi:hypothetical protein